MLKGIIEHRIRIHIRLRVGDKPPAGDLGLIRIRGEGHTNHSQKAEHGQNNDQNNTATTVHVSAAGAHGGDHGEFLLRLVPRLAGCHVLGDPADAPIV